MSTTPTSTSDAKITLQDIWNFIQKSGSSLLLDGESNFNVINNIDIDADDAEESSLAFTRDEDNLVYETVITESAMQAAVYDKANATMTVKDTDGDDVVLSFSALTPVHPMDYLRHAHTLQITGFGSTQDEALTDFFTAVRLAMLPLQFGSEGGEISPAERAKLTEYTLLAHCGAPPNTPGEDERISDLIADLMHVAHHKDIDFAAILDAAHSTYNGDLEEYRQTLATALPPDVEQVLVAPSDSEAFTYNTVYAAGKSRWDTRQMAAQRVDSLNVRFVPRPVAENDDTLRQLIPYGCVVRVDNCLQITHVLTYRRGKSGSEARLHGNISIGYGGHVNPEDKVSNSTWDAVVNALRRELTEELMPFTDCGVVALGCLLLNDADAVGRVHVGIPFLVLTMGEVHDRDNNDDVQFVEFDKLDSLVPEMEQWSKQLTDYLRQHAQKEVDVSARCDRTISLTYVNRQNAFVTYTAFRDARLALQMAYEELKAADKCTDLNPEDVCVNFVVEGDATLSVHADLPCEGFPDSANLLAAQQQFAEVPPLTLM